MAQDRNGLEILDRAACRRLLGTQVLGRIGVTVNALPVVLPVNYQLFEADGSGGWSVAVTGIANEITDPNVIAQLRVLPFTRWVRNENDRYVGISLDLMSGRRIVPQNP